MSPWPYLYVNKIGWYPIQVKQFVSWIDSIDCSSITRKNNAIPGSRAKPSFYSISERSHYVMCFNYFGRGWSCGFSTYRYLILCMRKNYLDLFKKILWYSCQPSETGLTEKTVSDYNILLEISVILNQSGNLQNCRFQ